MSYESYRQLCPNADAYLKPGKSHTLTFDGTGSEDASRLFFTGESGICYLWKSEPDYQTLYRRIDDALDYEHAEHDRYCLNLSGDFCPYEKLVCRKLVAPFNLSYLKLATYTDDWTFGLSVKARDLVVRGHLRMTVEIRLEREGMNNHSIVNAPDEVFTLDFPEGTYEYQKLEKAIRFDAHRTANVYVYVEGEDYAGTVYVEEPFFASFEGRNLLPPFAPHASDRQHFNWIGQNLSQLEWTGLKIELNGMTVFHGKVFECCHRFSDHDISLPAGAVHAGENTVTFTCTSDFREAPAYCLREIGLVSDQKSRIISIPENVSAGEPFAVWVDGKAGETIAFASDAIRPASGLTLTQDGLNALRFVCDSPALNVPFTLDGESCLIARCVEHAPDGVIAGTGDMVYININETDVQNYLKWYVSNHIGHLLTIRPVYRWCGTRVLRPDLWRKVADTLAAGGIQYAHLVDGRELAGGNANPDVPTIASDHFLGRQMHELDGAYSYWGIRDYTHNDVEEMFYDTFVRMYRQYPTGVHLRYIPQNMHYEGGRRTVWRTPVDPADMKQAAELFVQRLKNNNLYDTPRHTGPATLFKYFYQAGYKWTGAELMYSPTELTASALRGARDLYGGKTGSHLAVQWSSSPHDTVSRYRRYRLALFICYMQDIDEINTEEGLWRLEEYYSYHHRFSPACQNHLIQHQDFHRFITTHSRTGRFDTPIAFLNGRYDGWRCFNHGNVWGVEGMPFGEPEAAWDLLTFFYPKSVLNSIYRHDCPDQPMGYYSGTPYGNVDIVPIEAPDYSRYRLLVAPGYNMAMAEDLDKLTQYVQSGGVLVTGWPQLSITTLRTDVVSGAHNYLSHPFTPDVPAFAEDTFEGLPLHAGETVPEGEVFLRTDSGRPLVILRRMGEGVLWFVNAREYAGAPAVDAVYRRIFEKAVPECLAQDAIRAEGDSNVQFTVYTHENGMKNFYFIATDWHRPCADGKGRLLIGEHAYTFPVPFGSLIKAAACGEAAIYPEKDENEAIAFDGTIARVQGVGKAGFVVFKDGAQKTVTVDFTQRCVQEIRV